MPRATVKPPKKGLAESQVLAQITDAARAFGIVLDRQNTGGMANAKGQYVPFGQPGNSDLTGILPDGRRLDVECKQENYRPPKRGKDRDRFDRQLERLRRTNANNGVGFWVDNVDAFIKVIKYCLDGGAVEESEDGNLYLVPRKAHVVIERAEELEAG